MTMNNKITIGQYIPTNSWLHRLDPRVKILSLIVMLVAVFIVPISSQIVHIIMLSSLLVLAILLTISAKVPLSRVLSGIRPVVFLLTFTFVLQIFANNEGDVLREQTMYISLTSVLAIIFIIFFYNFTKKYIKFRIIYFFLMVICIFFVQAILPYVSFTTYDLVITSGGVIRGLFLFIRIITIIFITSLLTFTTMTTDLNYGMEALFKPLTYIKVPVEMMAMMLSLILRYIPTLLFETEKIMKAQASRGLDFSESKLKEKLVQVIALLVPIFVISLNRAEELSDAMEARGYVIGEKRTRVDEYKIKFKDLSVVFASLIVMGLVIYFRIVLWQDI